MGRNSTIVDIVDLYSERHMNRGITILVVMVVVFLIILPLMAVYFK